MNASAELFASLLTDKEKPQWKHQEVSFFHNPRHLIELYFWVIVLFVLHMPSPVILIMVEQYGI